MLRASIYPALPAEVLLEVFGYLSYNDTRSVLNVNSFFRAVAQPYAYQHGTMTKYGLYFPGATHPYPFSDNPKVTPAPLSTEQCTSILQQLKRIDVARHSDIDCDVAPPFMRWKYDLSRIQVANIELHSCSEKTYWCQEPSGLARKRERSPQSFSQGNYCPFIRRVIDGPIMEKVVVKDIPRSPLDTCAYFYDDYLLSPHTHVAVVYSQTAPRAPEKVHTLMDPTIGSYPFGMSGSHRLEVIFWTTCPGQAWIPPCKYYTQRGGPGVCNAEKRTVWRDLAAYVVGYRIKEVAVINASAILPPALAPAEHEQALLCGQAHLQAEHAWWFEAEVEHKVQTYIPGPRENSYEFMSMEEWIRRGAWQDVFSHDEIEPWLAKMREDDRAGRRTSQCAVVYVSEDDPSVPSPEET